MNLCPNYISKDIFVPAIIQSKKKSALSIFSGYTCAIYKCIILHNRIRIILLLFYNIILKQRYCPNRLLKILEIFIEKRKGSKVRKLRKFSINKG